MIMSGSITQRQREILESIRDGSVPEAPPTGYRISARALANRRLVAIYGHGDEWYVELTDAGRHYLETGDGSRTSNGRTSSTRSPARRSVTPTGSSAPIATGHTNI